MRLFTGSWGSLGLITELTLRTLPQPPLRRSVCFQGVPEDLAGLSRWLLGSSLFSAQLAAERGLPFAFASHFAPRLLLQALDLYRARFRPSATLAQPYAAIGVPLIAAPTDDEAEFLASSTYQRVLGILTGDRRRLQPPMADFWRQVDGQARAAIGDFLAAAVVAPLPSAVLAGGMLWWMTGVDFLETARTWWFAHALSIAVLSSLGLALTRRELARFRTPARAAEAVLSALKNGLGAAMNLFNRKEGA
jgi:alkanesulfonate monooxygenase SsuD/methylene tetrahydromethanopterin reductase-like flavin-dependent oxidoreductase (luciferase family)